MYKKRHFNSKQTFKMCSRPEPQFFQCVSNKVFAMGKKLYRYFLTVTCDLHFYYMNFKLMDWVSKVPLLYVIFKLSYLVCILLLLDMNFKLRDLVCILP